MLEENKKSELKDEDLEKVSGGYGYSIGNPKPQGYAFYISSVKSTVYKVYDMVRYIDDHFGYEYIIDVYYYGEYVGHNTTNFYDYDIDNFVDCNGRPE